MDPKNTGLISGGVAKPLLEASGLSLPILGEIWNLSDSENAGYLNQFAFCVAMRLIAHAQKGDPITVTSANLAAPIAKFRTIQVNNTGSGILNNHLSAPLQSSQQHGNGVPPPQPRITSSNSVQSFASHSSTASNPSLVVPVLSSIQAANFGAMFDKTAVNGILPGAQAKNIFLKARLPIPILEQIWNLVDQKEAGQLTRPQFIIAMHLIQCFMNKSLTILPTVLSNQLWKVAGGNPASADTNRQPTNLQSVASPPPRTHSQVVPLPHPQHAQTAPLNQQLSGGNVVASPTTNLNTWIMSSQQKSQYGAIFDTLDTTHESSISSSTVANFLMTSKLPNQVLANIWELANLDQSDNFTKQEFSIAMYLVQKKLAGYELPEETPLELVQSSSFNEAPIHPSQFTQPPQSFASAKAMAAPQRTPSHMDDLLGIFQTASPVAAAPAPLSQGPSNGGQHLNHSQTLPPPAPSSRLSTNLTGSHFTPTTEFGRGLQKSVAEEDEESSDDDDGPENLDLPRVRGAPPAIPGRSNKPNFDSEVGRPTSNYDAIKQVSNDPTSMFSNQPASNGLGGFTNSAISQSASSVPTAATISGFSNSAPATDRAFTDQITQASVDIANYSNQVASLSRQTSVVSGKKDKAQNELNKILKKKEEILGKLSQLKALHEKENQQVYEVQNVMIKSKAELDELEKELSINEANYHAEQTKKEQLQAEYEESQKNNQMLKEQLGTLNAENIDLRNQIEDLSGKVKQSNNMLAVTQQQVATQDAQNEELRQRVSELNNTIFQIHSKHESLLHKIAGLNDENLGLHEQHTDLSIQSANKNVEYSEALAEAANKGVIGDDFEAEDANGEIPTASLDDFDEEFGVESKASQSEQLKTKAPDSPGTTTDTVMSKQTDTTNPTQTASDSSATTTGQQFSLPFGTPHSETSSTRNNPSQSERGDLDASPTSTIEQTGPLSSQILPEGTVSEAGDSASSQEKSESFEMINHPVDTSKVSPDSPSVDTTPSETNKELPFAASSSMAAAVTAAGFTGPVRYPSASGQTSEVETLSDTPHDHPNQTPELDEFPPIQELEPLDDGDSSSSDEDNFQDAHVSSDLQLAKGVAVTEDSKNPFNKQQNGSDEMQPPVNAATGPSMFDDLGLEEAQVEDSADAFDSPEMSGGAFSNIGFTYAGNDPNTGLANATTKTVESADKVAPAIAKSSKSKAVAADSDDWEQVFAGFGNDPHLQPASVEEGNTSYDSHFQQPAVFGFSAANEGADGNFSNGLSQIVDSDIAKAKGEFHSKFSEAQQLAVEELSDMGFESQDAIAALKLKNWNIDDASNYLLDKS